MDPGAKVTVPPGEPWDISKVHPQRGPGETSDMTPEHIAKQSAKIEGVTQVGTGLAGAGAG